MTFKKIVESYVKTTCQEYVRKLCKQYAIPAYFVDAEDVTFQSDKNWFTFDCEIRIFAQSGDYFNGNYKTVFVGGTIDEWDCLTSCIRTPEYKYIWFEVEKTRQALEINEFKI